MSAGSGAAGTPTFPPLFKGEACHSWIDPFQKSLAAALRDPEPGRLIYASDEARLSAAVTLAPQMPLEKAVGVVFAVELGLADAIGALAPPEVAVHFVWPDLIKVNGAYCGEVFAAASTDKLADEPDWLVVGIKVPLALSRVPLPPERTTLAAEGCVDLSVGELVESWSRHMLVWINTFTESGLEGLHKAWSARCDTLGEDVHYPREGTFLGLDEQGGMIIRSRKVSSLIPLTAILDEKWPASHA